MLERTGKDLAADISASHLSRNRIWLLTGKVTTDAVNDDANCVLLDLRAVHKKWLIFLHLKGAGILMAHRIELGNMGAGGVAIVICGLGAAYVFGPQTVSRGLVDDVALSVFGTTYSSHVQCDPNARVETSLLKAFVGIHDGQRVLVRGYAKTDAEEALQNAFPDCRTTNLNKEGKPMWRKFI